MELKNNASIKFYDTSALLNGNYPTEKDWVSATVLRELENIKIAGDRKNDETKKAARKVARFLLNNPPRVHVLSEKQWKKVKSKYSFTDTGDNHIIAELLELKYSYPEIELQTSDVCLYLLAQQFGINSHFAAINEDKGGLYTGYIDMEFSEADLDKIYSDTTYNPCNLLCNQYLIMRLDNEIVDVKRWNGTELLPIDCKDINNKFMDVVRPRDVYQKMAMDLLERDEVPVKLIHGVAGSGKDYLSTAVALDKVFRREINKIYFIRNLIDLKDAPQVGYLAGSLEEKISWGLGPIYDILGGEEGFRWVEEQGVIEQLNYGFLSGRSLGPRAILYTTEQQNTTESMVQSLISRAGEESQLFLNADMKQIDKNSFKERNGVVSLQQNLKGHHLFGAVYLPTTQRSEVAELAGLLSSN